MLVVDNGVANISVITDTDSRLFLTATTFTGYETIALTPDEATDLGTVLLYWAREGKLT